MTKSLKTNIFFFLLVAVTAVVLNSCGDDPVTNTPNNPDPNTASGSITFLDSNIVPGTGTEGYYSISAFTSWPPTSQFTSYDSLEISGSSGSYTANYKLTGLANGTYYLVVGWTKVPYVQGQNYVLGLYNCNPPTISCSPTAVTITNNEGQTGINFVSYSDTANAIIQF